MASLYVRILLRWNADGTKERIELYTLQDICKLFGTHPDNCSTSVSMRVEGSRIDLIGEPNYIYIYL